MNATRITLNPLAELIAGTINDYITKALNANRLDDVVEATRFADVMSRATYLKLGPRDEGGMYRHEDTRLAWIALATKPSERKALGKGDAKQAQIVDAEVVE